MEIIILENFAISEIKVLALKWCISCLRKTEFKCTNLMEKVGCLNSWTPCSKKIERIRAHLKDCLKKKYLEKSKENVLNMSKLSSRNSDISVPSNLNISDVSLSP